MLDRRVPAPRRVLHGGDHLTEYAYRQPKTPVETARLVEAAGSDPLSGYGCDGDSHWTPAAIRQWWRDRGRITEYLSAHDWDDVDWVQDLADAVRDYESYLAEGLAADLRIYLFRLEGGRSPSPGERLPAL